MKKLKTVRPHVQAGPTKLDLLVHAARTAVQDKYKGLPRTPAIIKEEQVAVAAAIAKDRFENREQRFSRFCRRIDKDTDIPHLKTVLEKLLSKKKIAVVSARIKNLEAARGDNPCSEKTS